MIARTSGRILCGCLVGLMLVGVPWAHATNLDAALARLRAQEAALQRGLDRTLRDRSQTLNMLRLTEDRVAKVDRKVARLRAIEAADRDRLAVLDARAQRLRTHAVHERIYLANEIRAAYMMGRAGSIQVFLSQQNPRTVDRMLVYYHYILRARTRRIRMAHVTLRRIAATTQAIQAENAQLMRVAATRRAQKQRLEVALQRRAKALSVIDRRAQSGRAQLAVLLARGRRLRHLLRGLRRLPGVSRPIPALHGHFAAFRGHLPRPIQTPFRDIRADNRGRGLAKWAGVFLPGQVGEKVYAVFPGRVVYANWLRGYGLLLILENGDGYMTLYGHNQSLLVQVGAFVRGGQQIATVGDSGGFARPGLYFDISHDGQPLDPLVWLAH